MKILQSGDGGGVGGAMFLRWALQMEHAGLWAPDALSGTSVLGMLSLMLAAGKRPSEIDPNFLGYAERIFHDPGEVWKLDPETPKYNPDGMEDVCDRVFGTLRMCDLKIPVGVAVSDYQTVRVRLFTRDDNDLVRDVALRTAAAQTFFPFRENRWGDGGIVATNPTPLMLGYLRDEIHWDLSQTRAVSFDTSGGFYADLHVSARMLEVQMIQPTIKFAMGASARECARAAADMLPPGQHMRLEPNLAADYEMDDVSAIPRLQAAGDLTWATQGERVRSFLAWSHA